MERGVSIGPINSSQTPVGCPGSEHNCDTIFPEMVSDSVGKRLSPTRLSFALLFPPAYFGCQSKAQIVTYVSDSPAKNNRFPWRLLQSSAGLINMLEQLTELRQTFYSLAYWFIIK